MGKTAQELFDELQKDIEQSKRTLKSKELMLHLLKGQNKQPFIKTKLGEAYLKLMSSVTRPFARLNENANKAFLNPDRFLAEQLMSEAEVILDKCREFKDNSNKKAWKMAAEAADLKIEMDNYPSIPGIKEHQDELAIQIARLRPTRTPDQQASLEKTIGEAVEHASNLAATVNNPGLHLVAANNLEDQPF